MPAARELWSLVQLAGLSGGVRQGAPCCIALMRMRPDAPVILRVKIVLSVAIVSATRHQKPLQAKPCVVLTIVNGVRRAENV